MFVAERTYDIEQVRSEFPDWKEEVISLTWEVRSKSHGKRISDQGLEFGLSLSVGSNLREGDYIVIEPEQKIIKVREAKEPVYVFSPDSKQDWAYLAYQIGNRHQMLMIDKEVLICLQDPAVELLLRQLEVEYQTGSRCFTPALNVSPHRH